MPSGTELISMPPPPSGEGSRRLGGISGVPRRGVSGAALGEAGGGEGGGEGEGEGERDGEDGEGEGDGEDGEGEGDGEGGGDDETWGPRVFLRELIRAPRFMGTLPSPKVRVKPRKRTVEPSGQEKTSSRLSRISRGSPSAVRSRMSTVWEPWRRWKSPLPGAAVPPLPASYREAYFAVIRCTGASRYSSIPRYSYSATRGTTTGVPWFRGSTARLPWAIHLEPGPTASGGKTGKPRREGKPLSSSI
jgi:hypothetical protein